MSKEYRIEYQILRSDGEDAGFVEIGFGSSATWYDIDSALYSLQTDIQRRGWETEPGQPDPDEVDR